MSIIVKKVWLSREITERPHAPSRVAAFTSAHSNTPYITPSMGCSSGNGGVWRRRGEAAAICVGFYLATAVACLGVHLRTGVYTDSVRGVHLLINFNVCFICTYVLFGNYYVWRMQATLNAT